MDPFPFLRAKGVPMRIAAGFVRRSVGDSYMVVPVGTRTRDIPGVIALSETGNLIWARLERGATEEELVDALLADYEVDRPRAEQGVRQFLSELSGRGWLEE